MDLTSDRDDNVEHDPAGGSRVEAGVVEHPSADDFADARELPADSTWFKHAVFYEVLVRAFYDSNADGFGDLRGLTERIDYLQWLGVDCIWLPPFYDSPLRDGGYDIRDFYKVLPEFGTVDDFVELLDAAHRRGIRVITDLVMNHTSESHPWFQESRRDPDGPYGDYYVWSDSSDKYADARIIFVDTEDSNWTFDPVRRQFYWHRFFDHQADLNYDNPAVQEAMLDVMRFWVSTGSGWTQCPTCSNVRAPTARTCPKRTRSSSASARSSTTNSRVGCCLPRQISGQAMSSSISATPKPVAMNATWPFTSR